MRVLAIDPGEGVGWAVGEVHQPDDPAGLSNECRLELQDHGISQLKQFALDLFQELVIEKRYDVVVYETFRINPKKARSFIGNDMPTIQLIGMIRLCCWIAQLQGHPVQIVTQGPSAKTSARRSIVHEPTGVFREKVAAAEKRDHADGHDGDALLHMWNYYFERFF